MSDANIGFDIFDEGGIIKQVDFNLRDGHISVLVEADFDPDSGEFVLNITAGGGPESSEKGIKEIGEFLYDIGDAIKGGGEVVDNRTEGEAQ